MLPGLSASAIARLKDCLGGRAQAAGTKRDLSAKRYVYVWADGIHLQARLEDDAQCILVLIGATPEGKKELIGFTDGTRESAHDWRELAARSKAARAGRVRRNWPIADGALGFWKAARRGMAEDAGAALLGAQDGERLGQAAEEPAAEGQARLAGDLDGRNEDRMPRLPLRPSSRATQVKYEKAAECLEKDRDALARVLRLPRRALEALADDEPDREHVRHRAPQDHPSERLPLEQDGTRHGLQAGRGRADEAMRFR